MSDVKWYNYGVLVRWCIMNGYLTIFHFKCFRSCWMELKAVGILYLFRLMVGWTNSIGGKSDRWMAVWLVVSRLLSPAATIIIWTLCKQAGRRTFTNAFEFEQRICDFFRHIYFFFICNKHQYIKILQIIDHHRQFLFFPCSCCALWWMVRSCIVSNNYH